MIKNIIKQTGIFTTLPVILLLTAIPQLPASAKKNNFDTCVKEMIKGGIADAQAATACADALEPKELSQCVQKITEKTQLPAENVLQNCYQVRRPLDLATCVTDIHSKMLGITDDNRQTILSIALNSCRSSLLPLRYADCVIGVNHGVATVAPDKAMDTCLSAEDFPRDLFPSYVQ